MTILRLAEEDANVVGLGRNDDSLLGVRGIRDTNLVEFGRNDGPLLVERER